MTLPDTGGPAATWLVGALVCVLAGCWLVRRGRASHGRGLGVVLVVVVASGLLVAHPPPGQAAAGCESGSQPAETPHALTIEQTSIIKGLAPAVAPTAIIGTVTNTSQDSTYVTDVTVRITSVTKQRGQSEGACTASDYVLLSSQMPVNRPLPKLSAVTFSGASIGFRNTSRNQDTCQGATVHLGYVSGSR
ncbi:hypothetical protein [Aeromicrobium sp. UC242_57]|uniref:hypothetical protein n=1 Tax=Aeromicrobium sp. UC242_57 TaxID=3374624 RepID=UPI0037C1858C